MQKKLSLAIVGFMGSGKTTLLTELMKFDALREYDFYDLDEVIEKNMGVKIQDLINKQGLRKFRIIERKNLIKLTNVTSKPKIISLGGGALDQVSFNLLSDSSFSILWADTPFEDCLKRIRAEGNIRPLNKLSDEALEKLYKERLTFYEKASFKLSESREKLIQILTSSTM